MDLIDSGMIAALSAIMHAAMIIYGAVAAANVADMVDAIVTARSLGRDMESAKLRHALWKLSKYWLCMTLPFLFDCICTVLGIYRLPYALGIVACVILLIEFWSMNEHARCRRDRTAKIPEVLRDVAAYLGDDNVKRILVDAVRLKAETAAAEASDCMDSETTV